MAQEFYFGTMSAVGIDLLKNQFPSLFWMAHLKNATVHAIVSCNGDLYHWNLTFVRSLNDWEEDNI